MEDKIVVGSIDNGLTTNRTPINIDNDAFPVLINAYQWRGRVKRKRGTSLLGRLTRYFNSLSASYGSVTTITLNGSGVGNLLTGFSLQTNGNIVPGTVTITAPGPTIYTDPAMDGTLSPTGSINYATGQITILAQAGMAVSAVFRYYPDLPVMGIEDVDKPVTTTESTLLFDTTYSYAILNTSPYQIYDVSFYKNPATGTYAGYTQKTTPTPVKWNGQNYQQFWTTNYQGVMWATNGIENPFDPTALSMQFKLITTVTVTGATTASLAITAHGLSVGDFVFINEVATTTGINFQTGYVTTVTNANTVVVTFPNANLATNGTGGIAQYLTNNSDSTKDCLRWYDGDPTNGNATTPVLNGTKGWVNFCPPLSELSFSTGELPAAQYYLVGAKMIFPFKDRLCFIAPVVQTSTGSPIFLEDTVIYSLDGTPFYTASFTENTTVTSSTTTFFPLLTPVNQTSFPSAFFEDQIGFGGYVNSGIDEEIMTASLNEDVIIMGFEETTQSRFVFTGNDIIPFQFYTINSELPSSSTFSSVNLDRGVITRGNRGIIITSQYEAKRIDLAIPDSAFQISLTNNGSERFCSARDYINEWIYFTYRSNSQNTSNYVYPTQTLFYNYRDDSWAIFNECYTTYGQFRKQTGYTWATIGQIFPTWSSWNQPWNAGSSTLLQPEVVGGNQQGFVLIKNEGTDEANSLYIRDIASSVVTSPDHCLSNGDFIVISGCLGTVGSEVNGNVFQVQNPQQNSFTLSPQVTNGTYVGGGVVKRLYRPFIQTKQFNPSWGLSRKTRIGMQQYLLSTTDDAQITLLIYLSQNPDSAYNTGPIVPAPNTVNNSLIYSTLLYTCPESTNLGLTPANVNLQMPTASQQTRTFHRINTSLIGDTVQLAFTLSDDQMRDSEVNLQIAEIELHSFIINVVPSQLLA